MLNARFYVKSTEFDNSRVNPPLSNTSSLLCVKGTYLPLAHSRNNLMIVGSSNTVIGKLYYVMINAVKWRYSISSEM
jgi:hypothetical protein